MIVWTDDGTELAGLRRAAGTTTPLCAGFPAAQDSFDPQDSALLIPWRIR